MALVSITRALMHLRLIASVEEIDDGSQNDLPEIDEVMAKIDDATAIILRHVKDPDNTAYWDEDSTPGDVQAATLLVLSDLWEHRAGSGDEDVVLSFTVKEMLRGHRDPTLA